MITIKPKRLCGRIMIPSSKSLTIRALLIAAFCRGKSTIHNILFSSDTASCMNAIKRLGAKLTFVEDENAMYVDSTELKGADGLVIDCGNSGTTTYLLYGLLGTLGKRITITGDEMLRSRPILPLCEAYDNLGLKSSLEGSCPPVTISGKLSGGKCSIICPTSQYLSSLLLSLPLALEDSTIDAPILNEKPYVRITLSLLDKQHIAYTISDDLQHIEIRGGQHYHPFETTVTGDFSSATFFFCLAAILGTSITISGLDRNDSQGDKEILSILEEMGCSVSWNGYEVTVTGPKRLKGGTFDLNAMPDAICALAVTACFAQEEVRIVNVAQARIKETDRITSMHDDLCRLGADITELPDGLIIRGGHGLKSGSVKGYGDHRIIMAMAIAGLASDGPVTIDDEKAAAVTFPTFFTLLNSLKEV